MEVRRDVIGQRVLGPCRSACESEKVEVEVQRGDQLCSKGIYECRLGDTVVRWSKTLAHSLKSEGKLKGGGVGRWNEEGNLFL